ISDYHYNLERLKNLYCAITINSRAKSYGLGSSERASPSVFPGTTGPGYFSRLAINRRETKRQDINSRYQTTLDNRDLRLEVLQTNRKEEPAGHHWKSGELCSSRIVTRRFICRPSAVLLLATG